MPTLAQEFDQFWAIYPRRVSRQDAMKAYGHARVTATAEEILAGARAYLDHLPEDIRFVPYAASWLRASRWQDEHETALPVKVPADFDWYRECALLHGGACGGDRMRHHLRKQIENAS